MRTHHLRTSQRMPARWAMGVRPRMVAACAGLCAIVGIVGIVGPAAIVASGQSVRGDAGSGTPVIALPMVPVAPMVPVVHETRTLVPDALDPAERDRRREATAQAIRELPPPPDSALECVWLPLYKQCGVSIDVVGATAHGGGLVIVGARDDRASPVQFHGGRTCSFGAAYLFDASTGEQRFELVPDDRAASDGFGSAVAIGQTNNRCIAVVGAPGPGPSPGRAGTASVFDGLTGEHLHTLVPLTRTPYDTFGSSVAIDTSAGRHDGRAGIAVIAVGAPGSRGGATGDGAVFLFDAASGAQLAVLTPGDASAHSGFGASVAIDSGIVVVGAQQDNERGQGAGAAYLFDAHTGRQIATLVADDGAPGDQFGCSVAIDRGLVAVGAPRGSNNGGASGSVYVFDATTGQQIATLVADDGAAGDQFGWAVSIVSGADGAGAGTSLVAVGAYRSAAIGEMSGSVSLFDAVSGACIATLVPTDGAAGDAFGWSVGIDLGTDGLIAAAGAPGRERIEDNDGCAYVFEVPTTR